MRSAVITSLKWLVTGRFLAQFFMWIITILVIRILTPGDYGLMAIASLFVGFFGLFEELGLSAAIINKEELNDKTCECIFGILMVFGIGIYVLIYMLAPLAARFFEEERITEMLRILALRLPFASLAGVSSALLQRGMHFKKKSIVEFIAAVAGSICTLVLAVMGGGVYALVFGVIVQSFLSMIGMILASGRMFRPRVELRSLRSELIYGGTISADRFLWYVYSQADVFFIAKFLGKDVLGVYAVAMQLATLPMQKVARILNEVGFAAFSSIQTDAADVARKLKLAVKNLAFVSFPIFLGIAAIAPELVNVVLGQKWLAVAGPLSLLPIVVPLRLINATTPTVLFGIGRPEIAAGNSMIATVIFVPTFAAAAIWGDITTVCLVWLIGYPTYFLVCLSRTLPRLMIRRADYARLVARYLGFAAIMYLCVRLLSGTLSALAVGELPVMVMSIITGVIIYTLLLGAFDRQNVREFLALLRG